MFVVQVTQVCNNRCAFCFTPETSDAGGRGRSAFRSMKDIASQLRKGRAAGFVRANVSGLEATLHPRYLEIVRMAKRVGFPFVFSATNGRQFADARFLLQAVEAGLDKAIFSIHGHTAKLHDRQTGVPGSFAQAIQGLDNARRIPGFAVEVHCVLNRLNAPWAADILRYFERRAVPFHFLQLVTDPRVDASLFRGKDMALIVMWRVFESSQDPFLREKAAAAFEQYLNDEVVNWYELRDMHLKHLRDGSSLRCRGEQCRNCFMDHFCLAWLELCRSGRLDGRAAAPCEKARSGKAHPAFVLDRQAGEAGFVRFMDFYLENRYAVKGRDCASCPHERSCSGVGVRTVLNRGFPGHGR
jgi:MoaA/NifB/PqqE/SkfB family radical SAM enzyme